LPKNPKLLISWVNNFPAVGYIRKNSNFRLVSSERIGIFSCICLISARGGELNILLVFLSIWFYIFEKFTQFYFIGKLAETG